MANKELEDFKKLVVKVGFDAKKTYGMCSQVDFLLRTKLGLGAYFPPKFFVERKSDAKTSWKQLWERSSETEAFASAKNERRYAVKEAKDRFSYQSERERRNRHSQTEEYFGVNVDPDIDLDGQIVELKATYERVVLAAASKKVEKKETFKEPEYPIYRVVRVGPDKKRTVLETPEPKKRAPRKATSQTVKSRKASLQEINN